MTSTLDCNIIPDESIAQGSVATFDAGGSLLVAHLEGVLPGTPLPDSFKVEVEEGMILLVVRSDEGGHCIHEDDLEAFLPMVFG